MPGVNQAFSYLVLLSLYPFQKREAHISRKNVAYHLWPTRLGTSLSSRSS
ncbi:hypothetical protein SPAB_05241 [Salmonella enterica subsp. enterica serovar Paratyphi B str. SPB7]|uniref:Uncharacterized protein n=1 Tax=Salmonella paratyphi B (strain ATCC BAA-1250 / SPB7) TaxID=1016998 RepID=A0A6C6Z8Y1_SALPB|nr:hypothetical protein SPAB_05241 [Salmonella enterica subsp. enterica serovar Paratyphi B str. SPB7]